MERRKEKKNKKNEWKEMKGRKKITYTLSNSKNFAQLWEGEGGRTLPRDKNQKTVHTAVSVCVWEVERVVEVQVCNKFNSKNETRKETTLQVYIHDKTRAVDCSME